MSDYPGAEAHFLDPSVMFSTNAHKAIVVHKTAGDATPAAVFDTFKRSAQLPRSDPNWGRSCHYVVGRDGSIWQFVPENKGAGANGVPGPNMDSFWLPFVQQYGNLNLCTISIEHCDPSSANNTPLTSKQKAASFALVAHLCQKYNIPASNIKPHRSIAATTCPGNYPMDELIAAIKTGVQDMPIALTDPFFKDYFTGDDSKWHCSRTGFDMIGGILGFYRRIGGAPRLPLSGEKYDIPGVAYQIFESGVIAYDTLKKVDAPGGPFYPAYLVKLKSDLMNKILEKNPASQDLIQKLEQAEQELSEAITALKA